MESRRHDEMKVRQGKFLELYMQGGTIASVLRQMNLTRQTYERWRKNDRDFRSKMDALKGEGTKAGYDGSFISFRKELLGFESFAVHQRIVHALESMQPGEIGCVLVPPEFGKTTLLEDWCTQKICENQNIRLTYGSEGQPHARKVLGRIKRRLSDPTMAPRLLERYGPFYMDGQERRGKPWGSDYFTCWGADHDERDYTFEARGIRSSISGTRSDGMVVDDPQSVKSLNLTTNFLNSLRQDWFTRPGRYGWIMFLGTRVGLGDLWEVLLDEGVFDKVVIIPAMDANGESTCPELWPTPVLERRRLKVGESVWQRTYMQAPQSAIDASYTEETVDGCMDPLRRIGHLPKMDDTVHGMRVTSLDPALTGGNAIITAAFTSNRFDLLDAETHYNIGRYEAILTRLDEHARLYRPDIVVIEDNAFQKGFAHDDRLREMGSVYGFRIERHTTGRNKLDDAIGVARMAHSFLSHEVSWPGADEESRKRFSAWRHQFISWRADLSPKKHRMDLVMATWFAWIIWQRHKTRLETVHTGRITRGGLPWTPTPLSSLRRLSA